MKFLSVSAVTGLAGMLMASSAMALTVQVKNDSKVCVCVKATSSTLGQDGAWGCAQPAASTSSRTSGVNPIKDIKVEFRQPREDGSCRNHKSLPLLARKKETMRLTSQEWSMSQVWSADVLTYRTPDDPALKTSYAFTRIKLYD